MIYTTAQDYISQIVEPALGEFVAEHDIGAIADDMLIWHNEVNGQGMIIGGKSGLIEDESKSFWDVVESHAM